MTLFKEQKLMRDLLILIIIFIVAGLPITTSKTHFNVSMITESYLSKLLIIVIVFLVLMENYYLGLILMVLVFSIFFIDPKNISEGFVPYFEKN